MRFKQHRIRTQPTIEDNIAIALVKASDEKLLPKILWNLSKKNKTQKLFQQYRKDITSNYIKQLKTPLIYNPQQSKTQRQIFRQKVLKLMNNQLEVDYLKPMIKNGQKVMTYNGHQLDSVQYQTKKQYSVFGNINSKQFLRELDGIYDDKLELKIQKKFSKNRRAHTINTLQSQILTNDTKKQHKTQETQRKNYSRTTQNKSVATKTVIQLPKISLRSKLVSGKLGYSKNASPRIVQQVIPGKIILNNYQDQILFKIRQIGGYSQTVTIQKLCLTRQSIIKYLKNYYQKIFRIVDFLQFNSVQTYESYCKIIQNLKLMPKHHIQFLTFLLYDHNNDGYICQNDLFWLETLTRKCPILLLDINKIRKNGCKYQLNDAPTYLELYKLPEIAQNTYFQWIKSTHKIDKQALIDIQMKNYMLNSKKKKHQVFLDFIAFCNIFKKEKPFFWYDLLWRLAGIKFQGIRYT